MLHLWRNPCVNTLFNNYFLALLYARHTSSRARDGRPVHVAPGVEFARISLTKLRSLAQRGDGMRPIVVASAITAEASYEKRYLCGGVGAHCCRVRSRRGAVG